MFGRVSLWLTTSVACVVLIYNLRRSMFEEGRPLLNRTGSDVGDDTTKLARDSLKIGASDPSFKNHEDVASAAGAVSTVSHEAETRGPEEAQPAHCNGRRSDVQVFAPIPKCHLRHMAENLYMFTFIPTTSHLIMRHFFAHYASLGVNLRKRLKVVLHEVDKKSLQQMLDVMCFFNISDFETVQAFSGKIKTVHVNKWLQKLPQNSWAIYADSDEFFEVPCTTRDFVKKGQTEFWGVLADRLGPDMTIPELQYAPDIFKQYPLSCKGLRSKMGGTDRKYILFKVHAKAGEKIETRQFKNTHHFKSEYKGRHWYTLGHELGAIPHFTFLGKEALTLKSENKSTPSVYDRYAALFDLHKKIPKATKKARQELRETCKLKGGEYDHHGGLQ